MRRARRRFLAAGAAALAAPRLAAAAAPALEALPFSSLAPGAPLPAWLRPQGFEGRPKHTAYALVADAGTTVLHARAEASTSGLVRALDADPARWPWLAWRWKVANLVAGSDPRTKDGDDYPARLYLTFDLPLDALSFGERMALSIGRALWGDDLPAAALCYVWATRAPAGTMLPNAYTDRVRMIVAESGPARVGRWVAHRREVAADYRRAFGLEAGAAVPRVNGVIVSSDTDNTGETAEAWFGDVRFEAS